MLTEKDVVQIKEHQLTINKVVKHLETFARGIPFADIVTTATVGNGIQSLGKPALEKLEALYESRNHGLDIVKFVPASGAATRMFKFLYEFLESYDPEKETFRSYLKKQDTNRIEIFFNGLKDFAFINQVRSKIRELHPYFKQSSKGKRHNLLVQTLLAEDGLNFGKMPKGLIPFHKYKKHTATAFEEHLYEAAYYAAVEDEVYLHFTFSEKHLEYFKTEFENIKHRVSRKTRKNFHISYSFQKKQTDTLAVTEDNIPFRDAAGQLVFRPSGHGALLENLNEVDADVVFIKNIDNVAAQEYVEEIAFYKKALAGKLLWLQKRIFGYLKELEEEITLDRMKEMHSFIWNELNIKDIPTGKSGLIEVLDRPLRVCGVVKNTGAPGGGPFWVKDDEGVTSLQIVETSQINLEDAHQNTILKEATHFNPVDLVCGLRDYQGNKFNLKHFRDPNTGFISKKYENGKSLKALELPGLWNGSMAKWNTVFIEVPNSTFNPVKTVNDLLKKEHRPNA
ncbi:MAG TPA: DUF4301 family protein [Flavobacteriaceae bacterium]|nr:DUF4301 family protein [Flavobacteriaceae bacterium]MCB9212624.1 DUF4301 family protein [Alteromonas sp.]HPF11515.1 DUF4301 family protein [Flavobacteriaceae bacterium]HQU21048.1 DUF4301 family protein [Flavobacteriaceae bacterium]HQU65949.1 DUF4301 family protein [Flavobacteriaceae bacterium]